MSLSGSLEGVAAVILLLGAGLIVAALIWPLIRAIARRIEGGGANAELQAELETLRERVRLLEEVPPRMAELEERRGLHRADRGAGPRARPAPSIGGSSGDERTRGDRIRRACRHAGEGLAPDRCGDRLENPGRRDSAPDHQLASEVDQLRTRLVEVEERLDFAERLLTHGAKADQIPGGVQQ